MIYEIYVYKPNGFVKFNRVIADIKKQSPTNFISNEYIKDIKNKYFIIVENDNENNDFYSIRTDIDGNIIEFEKIGPNNYDKEIIIDAIAGNDPNKYLMNKHDKDIEKLTEKDENGNYKWISDFNDRIFKMNTLRIVEIYKKLKS